MITIDGSHGEGGGQVLRTSLGLSLVTGKPFEIDNIRAKRKKTGLMRQHLTAVKAAVEIGRAQVKGASLNSSRLEFRPSGIFGGSYRFAIGTAGSCTLVLQTILPGLLVADTPSELVLEGGTHNPMAPPFDFLQKSFLPVLGKMGAQIDVNLESYGFYPAGGGRFRVNVNPAKNLKRIDLVERGEITRRNVTARVSQIPKDIAEREVNYIGSRLGLNNDSLFPEEITNSPGPGNIIVMEVASRNITEIFTGFGQRGVRAEQIAKRMVDDVRRYMKADVPVSCYLADQLLIPMAMAGGGSYRTLPLTMHTETNIDIVRKFLDVDIEVEEISKHVCEIRISSNK